MPEPPLRADVRNPNLHGRRSTVGPNVVWNERQILRPRLGRARAGWNVEPFLVRRTLVRGPTMAQHRNPIEEPAFVFRLEVPERLAQAEIPRARTGHGAGYEASLVALGLVESQAAAESAGRQAGRQREPQPVEPDRVEPRLELARSLLVRAQAAVAVTVAEALVIT